MKAVGNLKRFICARNLSDFRTPFTPDGNAWNFCNVHQQEKLGTIQGSKTQGLCHFTVGMKFSSLCEDPSNVRIPGVYVQEQAERLINSSDVNVLSVHIVYGNTFARSTDESNNSVDISSTVLRCLVLCNFQIRGITACTFELQVFYSLLPCSFSLFCLWEHEGQRRSVEWYVPCLWLVCWWNGMSLVINSQTHACFLKKS